MTKPEAARFLRVSIGWIDRGMKAGILVYIKLGGRVLFRRSELHKLLKASERRNNASN